MKKRGKAYVGILLSLIMVFSTSVSALATEESNEGITSESLVQTIESVGEGTEGSNETDDTQIATIDDDSDSGSDPDSEPESDPEPDPDPDPVSVTGVSLSKTSLSMVAGQTATLTATVKPSDADNQNVSWSSNKESVATVKNGTVTAKAKGTATITVTTEDNGKTASCTVTVSACSDGFHKDPDSGDWYYYKNGKVASGTTDVIKGTVNGTSGWWNVVKGKVTKGETVAKNSNGWWYINSNGKVDFSYTGFAKNSNGWWYLESGKVNFNKNSVIKDTKKKIDGKQSWWYVVGGKVKTSFTGLADYKNSNGWWYISNGKVTFDVDTVAKNKNGWWYVKDSKVNFNYNGFAENKNGWWYINNGKVNFGKNSVIKGKVNGTNAWWYVVGGKVKTSFTGLADYKNSNGWWYINDGKVTFNVNTVAKNKNGWYYVKNSKVDFSYTGSAQNENGWWYIKDGKVDFSIGTVVKSGSDWLYYKGKRNSSFTGIAANENGTWYVKNGKVDFNYSGTVTANGTQYLVTNGKVGVAVSSTMNKKAQSQSSSTKWLIVIDTSACRLGVFQGSKGNWTAVKYWKCSPGRPTTPTKKGKFTVQSKGKYFNGTDYTCWYYTQFYGNYLIHSVLYYKGSMTKIRAGRLGEQLSHGCVRLAIENAKWIYDNIPRGSRVYIY